MCFCTHLSGRRWPPPSHSQQMETRPHPPSTLPRGNSVVLKEHIPMCRAGDGAGLITGLLLISSKRTVPLGASNANWEHGSAAGQGNAGERNPELLRTAPGTACLQRAQAVPSLLHFRADQSGPEVTARLQNTPERGVKRREQQTPPSPCAGCTPEHEQQLGGGSCPFAV